MSADAKTAVVEHLGRQHEAMALLGELVNIDSGSYNKGGADAVEHLLEVRLLGRRMRKG
jgi:hypothetical protein